MMAAFKAGEVERKARGRGEGGRSTEWPAGLAARRRERERKEEGGADGRGPVGSEKEREGRWGRPSSMLAWGLGHAEGRRKGRKKRRAGLERREEKKRSEIWAAPKKKR